MDLNETIALSRARFESWAAISAGELPDDHTDAIQVRLCRWQVANFDHAPDEWMGLGVVEELGEAHDALFEAETVSDLDAVVDGIGDVMIYASQIATRCRLAIGPIIEHAAAIVKPPSMITAAGRLSHVLLKRAQRIRGMDNDEAFRAAVVGALAGAIAAALSCDPTSRPIATTVFSTVAGRVMARNWRANAATGVAA